jgi:hypothetical protein
MTAIVLLFVLFWGIFLVYQKRGMLMISFSATLLYIFNQLELIDDVAVLWFYLFMYAVLLMKLLTMKE